MCSSVNVVTTIHTHYNKHQSSFCFSAYSFLTDDNQNMEIIGLFGEKTHMGQVNKELESDI